MRRVRAVAWAVPALVTALALTGALTGSAATADRTSAAVEKPKGAVATATDGVTHDENDRVPCWSQGSPDSPVSGGFGWR